MSNTKEANGDGFDYDRAKEVKEFDETKAEFYNFNCTEFQGHIKKIITEFQGHYICDLSYSAHGNQEYHET